MSLESSPDQAEPECSDTPKARQCPTIPGPVLRYEIVPTYKSIGHVSNDYHPGNQPPISQDQAEPQHITIKEDSGQSQKKPELNSGAKLNREHGHLDRLTKLRSLR